MTPTFSSRLTQIATLVLPLAGICGASVEAQSTPTEHPPTQLLVGGVVIDEASGEGVPGVAVTIGAIQQEVVTDSLGRYLFDLEQPTLPHLTGVQAFRSGYLPEERFAELWCHWIVSRAGETPLCEVRLDFRLRAPAEPLGDENTCSVTGTVSLEDGSPGVGTQIHIEGTRLGSLANASGQYMILNVPSGLNRVVAVLIGQIKERRLVDVFCETPGAAASVSVGFDMRGRPIR